MDVRTTSRRPRYLRGLLSLAAALSGGAVCGDCQTTFRDAVVTGTRDYILYDLLNPANYITFVDDEGSATTSP
jgi:hypothetical protein